MMSKDPTFIGYVPPASIKEAGVYLYRQIDTGKTYIGSTVNAYGRFIQHTSALARGEHVNKNFQGVYNESPFFEIDFIRIPPDRQNEDPLKVVRELEQKVLDAFKDKEKLLNIALDVQACGSGISPSAETRAKLSAAMRNRIITPETRHRISSSLRGRPLSEERKQKISDASHSRSVTVNGVVYKNATHAAKLLNLGSKQAVRVRCKSAMFPDYCFTDQLGNSPTQ